MDFSSDSLGENERGVAGLVTSALILGSISFSSIFELLDELTTGEEEESIRRLDLLFLEPQITEQYCLSLTRFSRSSRIFTTSISSLDGLRNKSHSSFCLLFFILVEFCGGSEGGRKNRAEGRRRRRWRSGKGFGNKGEKSMEFVADDTWQTNRDGRVV